MYSIGKYKQNIQIGYGPAIGSDSPTGRARNALTNASAGFLGAAIGIVLVIFVVAALVGPVANFTTGITIAHTGFTPNPNVTSSPGAAPLLQIYPLFFAIFGLLAAYEIVKKEVGGSF